MESEQRIPERKPEEIRTRPRERENMSGAPPPSNCRQNRQDIDTFSRLHGRIGFEITENDKSQQKNRRLIILRGEKHCIISRD
jgi:hypothetical protein